MTGVPPGERGELSGLRRPDTTSGVLLVAGGASLWGTTGTAQALAGSGASSVSVGTARLVLSGLMLVALALIAFARRGGFPALGRRVLVTAAVGGVASAGYQLAFFTGVRESGVVVGTVVMLGVSPVLMGVLATFVQGEVLTFRWLVCVAVAMAGVVLLTTGDGWAGVNVLGVAMAVTAGFCYAVYALAISVIVREHVDSGLAVALVMGIGALVGLPLLFTFDFGWLGTAQGAALALYLGIVTGVVAYRLFAAGLRSVSVPTASIITLLEPAVATVLGVLLLREQATVTDLAGVILVVVGIGLASRA